MPLALDLVAKAGAVFASQLSYIQTLAGIRRIKAELPGVFTVLGLSNISFGLAPAARTSKIDLTTIHLPVGRRAAKHLSAFTPSGQCNRGDHHQYQGSDQRRRSPVQQTQFHGEPLRTQASMTSITSRS